jgi:hypothetical protein
MSGPCAADHDPRVPSRRPQPERGSRSCDQPLRVMSPPIAMNRRAPWPSRPGSNGGNGWRAYPKGLSEWNVRRRRSKVARWTRHNRGTKSRLWHRRGPGLGRRTGPMRQLERIRDHSAVSSPNAPFDARRLRVPMFPSKKPSPAEFASEGNLVDLRGVEPLTSALRTQRSPN